MQDFCKNKTTNAVYTDLFSVRLFIIQLKYKLLTNSENIFVEIQNIVKSFSIFEHYFKTYF